MMFVFIFGEISTLEKYRKENNVIPLARVDLTTLTNMKHILLISFL